MTKMTIINLTRTYSFDQLSSFTHNHASFLVSVLGICLGFMIRAFGHYWSWAYACTP